jgi:hypothetical protein
LSEKEEEEEDGQAEMVQATASVSLPFRAPLAGMVRIKNTFITIDEPPTPSGPAPLPPRTEPCPSMRLCPTILKGGRCREALCRFRHETASTSPDGKARLRSSRLRADGLFSSKERAQQASDADEGDLFSSSQSTAPSVDGGQHLPSVSTTPAPETDSQSRTSTPLHSWSEPEHDEEEQRALAPPPPPCSSWGLREPRGPQPKVKPHKPLSKEPPAAPAPVAL